MGMTAEALAVSADAICASILRRHDLEVRDINWRMPVTDEDAPPAAAPKPRPALPDRLCVNPKSPHYNQDVLDHEVGIRFNGTEKTNVEEYCVSEGWVRLSAGKAKDRFGNAMTVKLKGKVEPYFKG
jgi:Protein of unknown function (DUF3297)